MTIQHMQVDAHGRGTEYRVNPKDPRIVEKRISANRWQVVKRCATKEEATTVLLALAREKIDG